MNKINFERKFLLGLLIISLVLFAILFAINIIKGLIDNGKGPILIIILLVLTLCYPTGNYILIKIGGQKN